MCEGMWGERVLKTTGRCDSPPGYLQTFTPTLPAPPLCLTCQALLCSHCPSSWNALLLIFCLTRLLLLWAPAACRADSATSSPPGALGSLAPACHILGCPTHPCLGHHRLQGGVIRPCNCKGQADDSRHLLCPMRVPWQDGTRS